MAAGPGGYWLAGADGGVFSFGVAFYGSAVGAGASPVVGITSSTSGAGYLLSNASGAVFALGDATFHGLLSGERSAPVVGVAA